MHDHRNDTLQIRNGEVFNYVRLEVLLRNKFAGISDDDMKVKQFSAGRSNLTYLVKIGDWKAVIRRAPIGPVNTKAHDIEREYQVLKAVSPIFPLAPKPFDYIEDVAIIGAPFYLMELKSGVLLGQVLPNNEDGSEQLFQSVSHSMVHALVDLHALKYNETNLIHFTKPDGFLERQVNGWVGRYRNVKTEEVPYMEELIEWIADHRPISQPPTFIHYDFHLKNVLFSENNLGEISGILDWEMSTVGDPLTDLASALVLWHEKDDPELFKNHLSNSPITLRPGFMTRNEYIEAYAKKSGRDVSNMNYYMVFGYFKHIVIMQQMYYRWRKGQTADERSKNLDSLVRELTQWAMEKTEEKF